MGIDEPSEFELLLGELERAADKIGDPDEPTDVRKRPSAIADEPTDLNDWFPGAESLREAPPSLVDLRALKFDDPLSHQMTQPIDLQVEIGPGSVVDHKYEILGRAPRAAGGWEARHVVLRQKFIVQLLARSIVDDPIMWPKFHHDIRSAGMLGHENIEFVTDLGRCEQFGAYLVKQWIDGPTLDEWLGTHGKRTPSEAVAFAHAIGEALAALHEIGIIHGRLSSDTIRRVETSDGPVWKLLDVCIPGGDERLLAPEQQRGEATGPEADQYAVAYLTWQMLLGPNSTPDDVPSDDAPEALLEVLRTALDDVPLMRWPDVETFVAEMSRAVPTQPTPSIHPFDRREASRHVRAELLLEQPAASPPPESAPDASSVAPPAAMFDDRPKSMVIRVLDASAGLEVEFGTGARLRREYRRNMLAGGLFVPTASELPVGQRVQLKLRYSPRASVLDVEAMVVTYDPGSETRPRGFGVAFDVPARQRIEEFVRGLQLGLGIAATDVLLVKRKLESSASLDTGAAFLLSRLSGNTTVGSARAMFSGLPYDFDECLSALIEQGYVEITAPKQMPSRARQPTPRLGAHAAPSPRPNPAPAAPAPAPRETAAQPADPKASKPAPPAHRQRPRTISSHEWADVARVLETVEYFEEQGNFMAAGRVLENATENAPGVAAFHHRLALMRARFDMDLAAARAEIRKARAIEPEDDEFSGAERYIATLIEMAAVRVAWERELTGTVSWIRTEPALGLIWFEEKGEQVALHEVDYLGGTAERSSRNSGWRAVPENDPEFDALEHRRPVPVRSERERHSRQIELARRFGGFGPHFEREPVAAARTPNSTLWASTQEGLRVFRAGAQLCQLSGGRVYSPTFSPNEQHVAWTEQTPAGKWALQVGGITGSGARRAVFEGRPQIFWSDDSSGIIALDSKTNNLVSVDRRQGEPKLLLDVKGSIDVSLIRSADDDGVAVVGRRVVGQTRWFCVWVDTRSGELRGEFVLPDGATTGIVRSDGKLALVLKDGRLLVADLERRSMKPVSTCSPTPESVAGARWTVGSPLIVAECSGSNVRVLSIDVDLLCG